ncbi:MAG TPA: hypothetical protein VKB96_13385 [Gammaproteobacteria bacterium]|nr:hypothetical protein [Gammaproteobacteria bacterium]
MKGIRVEISPSRSLARHNVLIVASDSMSDNLLNQEMVEQVRSGSFNRATEHLLKNGRPRMRSEDDTQPGHANDLRFDVVQPRRSIAGKTHADR